MSFRTSSSPISAYLVISTLRYTAQVKRLLGTGSRIPTTDERVGSRSRGVALDPASAESYVFGEW